MTEIPKNLIHFNDKPLKERKCKYCGKPIILKNKKLKFCNDVCRVYQWRKTHKRKDVKRPGAKVAYGRYVD